MAGVLNQQDQTAQTVHELTDIMQELAKRVEEQDTRLKSQQVEQALETAALKRRVEDLQQNSVTEANTVRQEYDLALDSLGSLIEDVAKRVTRAVLRFEERGTADLERAREQIEKALAAQSAVLTQKIDAAMAAALDRSSQVSSEHPDHESREGEDDHGGGTGSASAKKPAHQAEMMRRVETIAQMLRTEALAQSQAFEAKLSSIEAGHSAETKRWQGMLSSSFTQLQALQRSISQLETGLALPASALGPKVGLSPQPQAQTPLKPQREEGGSVRLPTASATRELTPLEKLREDLARKLRGIASSVNLALGALEAQDNVSRGQSPKRPRSPVMLPLNPMGTHEKQMRQRVEAEARSPPKGISVMTGPIEMREDGKRPTAAMAVARQASPPSSASRPVAPATSAREDGSNSGGMQEPNRVSQVPIKKPSSMVGLGMQGTHPGAGLHATTPSACRSSFNLDSEHRTSVPELQRTRPVVPTPMAAHTQHVMPVHPQMQLQMQHMQQVRKMPAAMAMRSGYASPNPNLQGRNHFPSGTHIQI